MFRLLTCAVLAAALAFLPACGPVASAPASVGTDEEDDALLEAVETRIAESVESVRESALALEYAATDAPPGTRRVATGVVLNEEGDVLSIRIDPPPASSSIVARDASGHRHAVRWVAADAETGLTLLRIDSGASNPVRRSSRPPRLGSQVLVVGNPFGLGHSIGRGAIAGLDRRLDLGPRPLGGLIQIDADLHPGDSGALVANLRGEWVGLIRSGLATPDAARAPDHGLGFAITARDALWIAEQLRTNQRVDRAYLGVRLDLRSAGDPAGAVLAGVLDGTPADRAGLQSGDRIVALDHHTIENPGDLTDRLDRTLAEAEVAIDYQRGSKRESLSVRTGHRPPPERRASGASSSKTDEPPRPLPREWAERFERLERRLDELERKPAAPSP